MDQSGKLNSLFVCLFIYLGGWGWGGGRIYDATNSHIRIFGSTELLYMSRSLAVDLRPKNKVLTIIGALPELFMCAQVLQIWHALQTRKMEMEVCASL